MGEQKNYEDVTNTSQTLARRLNVLLEQISMRTQELIRLKMENGKEKL